MPISFRCPQCNYTAKVDNAMAGKPGKCPKCQTVIHLGSPDPVAPPIVVDHRPVKTKAEKIPGWFFRWGIAAMGATSVIGLLIFVIGSWALPYSFFPGLFGTIFSLGAILLAGLCVLLLTALRGLIARKGNYPDSYRKKYYSRGWLAAVALSIVVCLFTKRSGNGWLILVHYASFIAAVASIVEFIKLKVSWARIRWAGIAVTALAVGVWWSNDYYVDTWTKEASEFDTYETKYKDYYSRFSKRPYYRKMVLLEPGKVLNYHSSEGPMTDTGKPHGKWSWIDTDWYAKPYESKKGIKFYWYGEEISEGDWHLRNK